MDIDKLKSAIEKAGFRVASDDELHAWLKAGEEYRNSEEGVLRRQLNEVYLDYCLAHAKYRSTPEMGEISGFGGGYEKTCQVMLDAGLRWIDEHPEAEPRFRGNSAVYGVVLEDNEDAKALSKAVVDAAGGDCTGAMYHAVISRCLWIKANGWDSYVAEMSKGAPDGD